MGTIIVVALICMFIGTCLGYAFRGKISNEKSELGKSVQNEVANAAKKI